MELQKYHLTDKALRDDGEKIMKPEFKNVLQFIKSINVVTWVKNPF